MLKSIVIATLTVVLVLELVHVSFAQRGRSYKEPAAVEADLHLSTIKLINLVKYSGCNFDSLLDGHTGPEIVKEATAPHLALLNEYADLLARSDCIYINRAVETWNLPPDFAVIATNMATVAQRSQKVYVFGEFVAESVSWEQLYYYPFEISEF